jgi:hypothetical protein
LKPPIGANLRSSFVRAVPRLGALPKLRTYQCKACAAIYTGAFVSDTKYVTWIADKRRRRRLEPPRGRERHQGRDDPAFATSNPAAQYLYASMTIFTPR